MSLWEKTETCKQRAWQCTYSHWRKTPTMFHIDDGQTHNDVNVGSSRSTVPHCLLQCPVGLFQDLHPAKEEGLVLPQKRILGWASMKQSWSSAEDFSMGFKMGVKRRKGAQKKRKKNPRVCRGFSWESRGSPVYRYFSRKSRSWVSSKTLVVEASEVSSQRGPRDALCFLPTNRCYFSLRPKS